MEFGIMRNKLRPIDSKPERVILSDILPFEMPLMVSNRHFYRFLVENKIRLDDNCNLIPGNRACPHILPLLFGTKYRRSTIPFTYSIAHKENDLRELAVIHPMHQLRMIAFYEKYKELILYYCAKSNFSIRRPCRIAKAFYYKDRTHIENIDKKESQRLIEQYGKEYETLKTFFVYKDYSNIHQFYESYRYHRCEKKYTQLLKFDVSKCFDSVYTHTIGWAIFNKPIVKAMLLKNHKAPTFANEFDKLMQELNYSETNGIVIGPEFSRIFAEIILQRVDADVENELKKIGLINKRDYEALRYVDDYFIFYNNDEDKNKILRLFKLHLRDYNFYVNDAKTIPYEKPIITEITVGKLYINKLLRDSLPTENVKLKADEADYLGYDLRVSGRYLITSFKTIIKTHQVEYRDVLNYTLASIERRVKQIIDEFHGIADKKKAIQNNFVEGISEILDFVFFLYAVSPRVNTTIKLCRILNHIVECTVLPENLGEDLRQRVFKKIHENISDVFKKNEMQEHVQVETLYLLGIICQLGRGYWLEQGLLCSYFGLCRDKKHQLYAKHRINYFTIVALLWYVRNKKAYEDIRSFLKKYIYARFIKSGPDFGDNTELTLLFLDIVVCPYLDLDFRRKLLALREPDLPKQNAILKTGPWFTQWENLEFGKALDAKKSYEVY